ncbi:MAG TPA: hypothetical protein VK522_22500 [Pseudolabrys sp.]|nr:hypothetical protein [Pseudolabrys sp.]
MDYQTARRMNRYSRLSERAWAAHARAIENGDTAAGMKAARLIERVDCRMDGAALSEVRPYSEEN